MGLRREDILRSLIEDDPPVFIKAEPNEAPFICSCGARGGKFHAVVGLSGKYYQLGTSCYNIVLDLIREQDEGD